MAQERLAQLEQSIQEHLNGLGQLKGWEPNLSNEIDREQGRHEADVHQITRAIGPAKTLYSVEHFGISDTALKDNRTAIAATASSETHGKHTDTTLYILDGPKGTMDTAFDAHAMPIKHWAWALWDGWFPLS